MQCKSIPVTRHWPYEKGAFIANENVTQIIAGAGYGINREFWSTRFALQNAMGRRTAAGDGKQG
ncbi:MAG: hypothetical protein GY874_09305 [Desulfobacteraceae bacterium]|nr:hypothetical protein [Desulfobacteraceae bacterium]